MSKPVRYLKNTALGEKIEPPLIRAHDPEKYFSRTRSYLQDFMRPIQHLLREYPFQPELVQRFLAFDAAGAQNYQRGAPGHFTASCWLVDLTGERVLLTHHRKLGCWLQLGGHADGDTDLVRVALTEACEESGLSDLRIEPAIFDLDVHEIPARASDPVHLHWDVRFVVRASSENFSVSEESLALSWVDIAGLAVDKCADASLVRMAQKWLRQPNCTQFS